MKVKVQTIKPPYTDVPTESLRAVLRNHAHYKLLAKIGTDQLYDIMEELAERNKSSELHQKTAEEALAEFKLHYMPQCRSQFYIDYAGGYDHCLLELSDVLPASLYGVTPNKTR